MPPGVELKIVETGFLPRAARSCHASTVLPLKDGRVLCAWFAGAQEGERDVEIYLSCLEKGVWSAPERMSVEEGPCWNPVLFENEQGEILLYYKTDEDFWLGKSRLDQWYTRLRVSKDGGRTFSASETLVEGDRGGRGPVRNHPITLKNGTVLAPASLEKGPWTAFVDVSEDGGHTFVPSNTIVIDGVDGDRRGVIQPALWEDESGVHMLLRSTENAICRSDSADGRIWSSAERTGMPNNNSGIDLCRLPGGTLALVHNPVTSTSTEGARTPLIISLSCDNGVTFSPACTLAWEPGEYSYPSIMFDGEYLHVSHTWKREDIRYARIAII